MDAGSLFDVGALTGIADSPKQATKQNNVVKPVLDTFGRQTGPVVSSAGPSIPLKVNVVETDDDFEIIKLLFLKCKITQTFKCVVCPTMYSSLDKLFLHSIQAHGERSMKVDKVFQFAPKNCQLTLVDDRSVANKPLHTSELQPSCPLTTIQPGVDSLGGIGHGKSSVQPAVEQLSDVMKASTSSKNTAIETQRVEIQLLTAREGDVRPNCCPGTTIQPAVGALDGSENLKSSVPPAIEQVSGVMNTHSSKNTEIETQQVEIQLLASRKGKVNKSEDVSSGSELEGKDANLLQNDHTYNKTGTSDMTLDCQQVKSNTLIQACVEGDAKTGTRTLPEVMISNRSTRVPDGIWFYCYECNSKLFGLHDDYVEHKQYHPQVYPCVIDQRHHTGRKKTPVLVANGGSTSSDLSGICMKCGVKHKCRSTLYQHYKDYHMPKDPLKHEESHNPSQLKVKKGLFTSKVSFGHEAFKNPVCTKCGQVFTQAHNLPQHTYSCTFDGLTCSTCSGTFSTRSDLIDHYKKMHFDNPKLFCCKTCGMYFPEKEKATNHSEESHSGNPLKCLMCKEIYINRYMYEAHLRHKHELFPIRISAWRKKGECTICGKTFSSMRSKMLHHDLIHLGLKTGYVPCDVCGKQFSNLKKHMVTHSGERPFICDMCGRAFAHKSAMLVHVHSHTGEKPYKCKVCGKPFSSSSKLSRHNRVHTGAHTCLVCGITFSKQKVYRAHMQQKHPPSIVEHPPSIVETSLPKNDLQEPCVNECNESMSFT